MGSTVSFVRGPRPVPPVPPGGELALTGPPEVARAVPQNLLVRLLPLVMVVALVGMVALMFLTGGRGALSNPLFLMFPLMMLMSMVGMLAAGGRGGPARSVELNEDRKDYLRYLSQTRTSVAETVADQRVCALWSHPEPATLAGFAGSPRMWERRPGDADFAHVRLGVGTQPLAKTLVPPEVAPAEDLEPVCASALRRFVQAHATVPELPTAVALQSFPAIGMCGPRANVLGLIRAMIAQMATLHGPDHLRVAVAAEDPLGPDWDWLKWLPHTGHPTAVDRLGPVRMIYGSLEELETDLVGDLADRGRFSRSAPPITGRAHLIVICDGGPRTGEEELAIGAGREGLTMIEIEPDDDALAVRRGLQLVLEPGRISALSVAGLERFGAPDELSAVHAEVLARGLARYRLAGSLPLPGLDTSRVAADPGLPALLGLGDVREFEPDRRWRGRSPQDRLRVPIGYTAEGTPVDLDLKESAHGGMGPHGLCIGATGSGKSEFLRTLVLALIATHSPEELNLVLVDFKGGATFLGLHTRHVAALITNLEAELTMVDRMADALSGELNRRQELLRSAGNFANVGEYERAREAGARLDPLPALFIVVDEFSELLAQKPEFAELFVAIGRLGRSLHIHLLLASQRLEEGRLRGLDSHLSYRIGLKTFSANESRTVLGVPDAYHLPSTPGAAYLKCDSAAPVRFNTSFVSGPYVPPRPDRLGPDGQPRALGGVFRFTTDRVPVPSDAATDAEPATEPAGAAASLLETLVGQIAGHGAVPHPVWLPPLEQAITLDGFVAGPADAGSLVIPMGAVDRPYDQRREPLLLDLSGAAGNAAIVGGPQSGKSTALRTLICAAAATHTPQQISFYCLDFGGGTLAALRGLPHVAGVATKNRRDAVRRTLAEVKNILTEREELLATQGLESIREYRAARREGRYADDPRGDVFLVIDGLATLRSEFEDREDEVNALVSQGLSYGVHVIVAAARWADIRPAMKDLLGTRLELRLGDPLDSEMGRKAAATVPVGRPGRGLTGEELHLLVALPRFDGDPSIETLPGATASFVEASAATYTGRCAPPLRLLEADLPGHRLAELVARGGPLRAGQSGLGLCESDLAPVILDFDTQPHLLIFGDTAAGKTQTLRTIVSGLIGTGGPEQTKVILVDYRRTLLGLVDADHLAGYASSGQTAAPMMAQLADYLRARLPGEDVTADELAAGSWWTGPTVYLVIDDYDLVVTAMGNPLTPLLDLLGHARDIGLRVILARRSGGLGRAMFDPVIAGLRDLSCDVLLLSGDADEGYVVGRSRMQKLPAGRGELISRAGSDMVQVAR
ncbi:FtsK/SpoIIIE family protein [Gordonia hirsuta DSM 44140 = NBRC 16056]|uniref:FtsK/SpoIIIE family protein n=1 Tax=Gordonia hirsuta DSM 44140 = NBRC 16056 TaxID=1121927 RepID=L7LFN5_9ACTN|nr:type VII secretion protein EccC [Gordonia hirsuta]GAC58892.1 FtsK/SpoIIIE family protein [Gordonia hirsuta DSM 44140 = NBRC 16056]